MGVNICNAVYIRGVECGRERHTHFSCVYARSQLQRDVTVTKHIVYIHRIVCLDSKNPQITCLYADITLYIFFRSQLIILIII